ALRTKSLQGLKLPLDLVLLPEIVGVEESDPLPPRLRDSLVPCRTDALIRLGVVADPIAKTLPKDLPRAIRRSVVHHDDFEVGKCLGQNAFDGLPDLGCAVIGGDNDGYLGIHETRSLPIGPLCSAPNQSLNT